MLQKYICYRRVKNTNKTKTNKKIRCVIFLFRCGLSIYILEYINTQGYTHVTRDVFMDHEKIH